MSADPIYQRDGDRARRVAWRSGLPTPWLLRVSAASCVAMALARLVIPSLTGLCLACAVGSLTLWVAQRTTRDPWLVRIVWWSFALKVLLAVTMFFVSYWSLPLLRGYQLGGGFWVVARDPVFSDWVSRWIVAAWISDASLPTAVWFPHAAHHLYCAGLYWLLGAHPLHVIFPGIGYSVLTSVVAYHLVGALGGQVTGRRVGAFLIAFWPSTFVWSTQILKEPLTLLLLMSVLWLMVRVLDPMGLTIRRRAWEWCALLGALFLLTCYRGYLGLILSVGAAVVLLTAALWQVRARPARSAQLVLLALSLVVIVYNGRNVNFRRLGGLTTHKEVARRAAAAKMSELAEWDDARMKAGRGWGEPRLAQMMAERGWVDPRPKAKGWWNRLFRFVDVNIWAVEWSVRDRGVTLKNRWSLIGYLPRAVGRGFLTPYPPAWLQRGGETKQVRRLASLEMVLLYGLVPGFCLVAIEAWKRGRLPLLVLLSFSVFLAIAMGYVVKNVGTLFRLRLQVVFPLLVLLIASPLATGWYVRWGQRALKLLRQCLHLVPRPHADRRRGEVIGSPTAQATPAKMAMAAPGIGREDSGSRAAG